MLYTLVLNLCAQAMLYLILLSGVATGMHHHAWLLGTSKLLKYLSGLSTKKKREEREEEVKEDLM